MIRVVAGCILLVFGMCNLGMAIYCIRKDIPVFWRCKIKTIATCINVADDVPDSDGRKRNLEGATISFVLNGAEYVKVVSKDAAVGSSMCRAGDEILLYCCPNDPNIFRFGNIFGVIQGILYMLLPGIGFTGLAVLLLCR